IYKTMYLSPFPIPIPQNEKERELASTCSELARSIQRSNRHIGTLEDQFETLLTADLPITSSGGNFYRDYYSVPEYWQKRRLIPENALEVTEPVVGIRVMNEVQH